MKNINLLQKLIIIFCLNLLAFSSFAEDGVAKVVIIKGTVTNLKDNSKLKKDDWLPVGAVVKTEDKGFVKLIFLDKSTMNISPNSQIEIQSFPKDKAGIVNLVNGEIRSQVTKNYMEIDKKESKLFIKTRTAAMGVRGTHFQVNFNPENMNTSLITFEGAVALGAINDLKIKGFNQKSLENIVSDASAVMVKRGEFSGVMPSIDTKPVAPVKINIKQLKILEKNDGSNASTETKSETKTKMTRGTIPPGVSGEEFQGASKKEVLKEISKVDIQTGSQVVVDQTKPTTKSESSNSNKSFRDGGYVNTQVVAYIAPPKNAAIDPMTKQPIIPVTLGRIDVKTGEYKNDYFKLENDLSWKPIVSDTKPDSRTPASSSGPSINLIKPPSILNDCLNCGVNLLPPPPISPTTIDTTKAIESSTDKIETIINQTQSTGKTKININIE